MRQPTRALCSDVLCAFSPPRGRAAFRSQIGHPIGGLDHLQIVLDDQRGVAGIRCSLEHRAGIRRP